MNKKQSMVLYLSKEQYDALYVLLDNIAKTDEDEYGEVRYHGTISTTNLLHLCSLGNQIFHNDTMKENLTKSMRMDKICRGCVFMKKLRISTTCRYYCMKTKAKGRSITGYKVINAKDKACSLYEPVSILG